MAGIESIPWSERVLTFSSGDVYADRDDNLQELQHRITGVVITMSHALPPMVSPELEYFDVYRPANRVYTVLH
jgi:hypothetical protein